MGRIRGTVYNAATTVEGVRLGKPIITRADGSEPQEGDAIGDLTFQWDDPMLPTGKITAAGVVTVDVVDEPIGGEVVARPVAVKVAGKTVRQS